MIQQKELVRFRSVGKGEEKGELVTAEQSHSKGRGFKDEWSKHV